MLFLVVERFRGADPGPMGERFRREGRMLPEGVLYHASWVDPAALRCYQILEAPGRQSLDGWIERWDDLVEFEIIPVVPSVEFWASAGRSG